MELFMRTGSWLLALAIAALLACNLLPRCVPAGWRPDLFAVLVALVALRAEPGRGSDTLALCWMTGLAKDLLSAGPVGQYALLYLAAGVALGRVRPALGARSAMAGAALTWVGALATEGVAAWALGREGSRLWPAPGAFHGVVSASFATACLAWPCFLGLDHWLRRQGKARGLKVSYDEAGGAV
jgi:rod shape-determining protein MreD